MVVHMVTLVTMAMVAVPASLPGKAKHIVVAPPEQQQVDDAQDFYDRQPETLDEDCEPPIVMADSIDAKVAQDTVAFDLGDELQAALAAISPTQGQDCLAGSEVMTIVHSFASSIPIVRHRGRWRRSSGKVAARPAKNAWSMR